LEDRKSHTMRERVILACFHNLAPLFGDCEPEGEGVLEMRIHHGPGFRVYFVRHGAAVYVLLCGGDKSSQRRDIAGAKRMARELKESGR
jgi:putative addiction module killer protein